jgi:DNA end-binding protein Ku
MKAIWTGSIGFGLVNIPIKIFSAVNEHEIDLDMLDKKDHSKIRYQRINEQSGKEVAWENIVKGYDYKGKYVIINDSDFEKLSPEKNKTITINEFVDEDKIESIFFETPYFLEPQKSGLRAYNLFHEALKKTGKVGIGTYVLRNKESLGIIKPYNGALLLNKIRFAHEVRSIKDLNIPSKTDIKPGELKMAISLINQLATPFNIAKYKDTYSDELMKLILAKAKGKKLEVPHLRVVHNKEKDLMSQLKASLTVKKKKAS